MLSDKRYAYERMNASNGPETKRNFKKRRVKIKKESRLVNKWLWTIMIMSMLVNYVQGWHEPGLSGYLC